MDTNVKVLLMVTCRRMKNPKLLRSRFDQTLISSSWMLQENRAPEFHPDDTVSTTSIWGRVFRGRKTEAQIKRIILNLLKRAAEDAGIDTYDFNLQFETISADANAFDTVSVITHDD